MRARYNFPISVWTEERNTLLRELWATGMSCAKIAAKMGGCTRNAVIGKAHRLGLEARESPIKNISSGRTFERRRRAKAHVDILTIISPLFNDELPKAATIILGQGAAACQWPHGNPGDSDFGFCGAKPATGRPYCADHVKRAYIPLR